MSAPIHTQHAEVSELAARFLPAFRDKYDFSEEVHFEKLAELSFKAAKAFRKQSAKEAKETELAAKEEVKHE